MRSPEHKKSSARHFDNEPSYQYLTPGAFTILTPEDDAPPDPPLAPQPYRLTPSARRHKNTSFAIIAEPGSSRAESRSPSPTGRVSPFRGRGFNPTGSRHASPAASPPPDAKFHQTRSATTSSNHHQSKIPTLTRRGSGSLFGEKVTDFSSSPHRRKLHLQLSQSLTNIPNRKVSNKPPASPRRNTSYSKTPAFQRLSPIVGSSPEPSQSQSSPSKIPKSQSQPSSRIHSPTRQFTLANNNVNNNNRVARKKSISRTNSINNSRDQSPSRNLSSPTKIPVKNSYKNVQAKVNSFSSKVKPKVPPKPQVHNEPDQNFDKTNNNKNSKVDRKGSVKSRTSSKSNIIPKSTSNSAINNSNNNNYNNTLNNNTKNNGTSNHTNSNKNNSEESEIKSFSKEKNKSCTNLVENEEKPNKSMPEKIQNQNGNEKLSNLKQSQNSIAESSSNEKKNETSLNKSESNVKLTDLLQPSTTTVVSSTTSTVTQPLKIEAKIDSEIDPGSTSRKAISPMVDGRVLSATSVSNAMNKMNDTVLDTQTLIKEHGLTKLSPAASTIISMSKDAKLPSDAKLEPQTTSIETKNLSPPSAPKVEKNEVDRDGKMNNNHVTTIGIMNSKILDEHVQNNMSKLIAPDVMGNSIQKSNYDRILESRTVVAADVKPLKITVKEKPMDADVESGNIRIPVSATNGLIERPSLPPSQPPSNEAPPENQDNPKSNACTRFFATIKNKTSCKCCKKENAEEKQEVAQNEEKTGCFNCRKKRPDVKINIEREDEPKLKIWQRLKCCSRTKVGDTGCFAKGKRKSSWQDRKDSILSQKTGPQTKSNRCSKNCCKETLRKFFCINLCFKKKVEEDAISRRASMMSKKKSLTPSIPPEDNTPKLDISLVEHTSHMKAAIPVLPIKLAWMCLVMNCIVPGLGTIISGILCLCIGKPRFSQKDGPRPRCGAFIIDLIIGCGQFFTVLFCLVGWGWSIWWGVIMLKMAKKYNKIKIMEENAAQQEPVSRQVSISNQNHQSRPQRRS